MAKNTVSKLSNAFSTGGGGANFEQRVQAMFLLSLLVDGFCPAMEERTKRVCFQAKCIGFDVDDLAVFTYRGQSEGKMLCQIKHSITISERDSVFQEVISAAWSDFNKEQFDREHDKIALVTAQIATGSQQALRFLYAQAWAAADENQFRDRVYLGNFSNADNRRVLDAIKTCISNASDHEPTDREMWQFCKCFMLLLFDMDCKESINRTLSASLIKCNSSYDGFLVWSRLVEYAGDCNQTAASVNRESIDDSICALFSDFESKQLPVAPIAQIDLFIPMLALIGTWNAENEFDRQSVEQISGMEYAEAESKARNMLCQNSQYLKLENGSWWKVQHKEDLLEQCKELLFDDCLERLINAAKIVFAQKSRRVTSKTPYYVDTNGEYDNSKELRKSIVTSLCWVKMTLPQLVKCNQNKIEASINEFVRNAFAEGDWVTWASLRDCLQEVAELAPDIFLKKVEWCAVYKQQEILRLFPKSNDSFFEPNYITGILWAIEALAWSPVYLISAIGALGALAALPYEKTNWSNTPMNSIVSILLPWHPQTLADSEKRKNALRCLKNDNPEVFWKVLVKLLPNKTNTTADNPKPKYLSLAIPEKITVTKAEVYEQYTYNLELAVETAEGDVEKCEILAKQIEYMQEATLLKYLGDIEKNLDSLGETEVFSLWLHLRERMAQMQPEENTVINRHRDKIQALIQAMEPGNICVKYRELYLGNRYLFDKGDFETTWKMLEYKKTQAIREIYDQYGVEETEAFGQAVNNIWDVAHKLGDSLNIEEISEIIEKYCEGKLSQPFYISCIGSFCYNFGTEKLMQTSLTQKDVSIILETLSKLSFSIELYHVVESILPEEAEYWKIANVPYGYGEDKAEELKLVVKKFVEYKRYVAAVNIAGRSKAKGVFTAQDIYNLLKLAGTENSIGMETIDDYAVQQLVGWLQEQDEISLEMKSDIEFIYLPMLDKYSQVHPHALHTRLSNDPDYFCSLIELCYKKRSEEKSNRELSKGLSERLFQILFEYKVTPGIDWNGEFHEDVFKKWMASVKAWSKENDRYAVTMHTVGAGFAYAELDDEKMPRKVIMEELNKVENEEIRRGYVIGISNKRGMHTIEPDGKPEKELAADYEERAKIAEERGYSRYSNTLREIANQYNREAAYNILRAQEEEE